MGTGAGGTLSGYGTGTMTQTGGKGKAKLSRPIDKKTKLVTYSADTPDLLLDLSATASATVSKTGAIQAVKVKNDGYVTALASFVYNSYTAEGTIDTDGSGLRYVKYLLNPNEEIILPTTRAIIGDAVGEFDGTPVTATAPNANEYTEFSDGVADVDSATADGVVGHATNTTVYLEPYTSAANCSANLFYVGDLIRVRDEVMEVTEIGAKGELATNKLTVRRGVHGSTAGTAAVDNDNTRLPFFNAYHDYDKYSVAQSDSLGRFKAMNFFGYGRSATGQAGLTAGSIAIQFYSQGYQKFGMNGITANTESGLAAATAYKFNLTVDGGSVFVDLGFTTDSSNLKFGGSTGIIALIQAALDTQYYTAGNLFEKKVTVSLENGDIVFRSGSFLSTSAILLAAPGSGTTPFGVGRIPAIANVNAPVASRLETETTPDPITNGSTYKQIFIRDDGYGNLIWKNERKVGSVNYESGAIDWTISELPNAEFVVSVLHTSPFSGKLDGTTAGRLNSLRQILGNTPQQKCEAKLTITTY
tara:strand:+ start:2023 stop:3612 length:1590 start_codon:yes stop_codon:yes gene_type:complete